MTADNLAAWLLEQGSDDAIVVTQGERSHTRGELRRRTRAVSARVTRTRIGHGRSIVALVGSNSFELMAAHLGVLHAGAVSAPLPPLSDEHLREILQEIGATVVFVESEQLARVQQLTGARVEALDAALPDSDDAARVVSQHELAILLYTSGSTSRPKGVMLSSANIRANTEAIVAVVGLTASDRALSFMPMHYAFGLSVVHTHLRVGASVAFGTATFPTEMLSEIQRTAATGLPGVPTLFVTLLNRTAIAEAPLPSLRYAMISGGRLNTAMIHRLREALPQAQVFVRYGVTEVTSGASALPPERADKIPSVGRGFPGAPLLVLRPDGAPVTVGVAAGGGEIGEIVVRSASVALGYFGDVPEARHFRDGGFHTGDLATVDEEGFVTVVGRERDFIKTAGFRVSPSEIEEVVTQLSFVEEAAVCAVPHPVLGESLVCCVVQREPTESSVAKLRAHCVAQLPSYKVPTRFELVDALPKTSNGKLDRRSLAARFAQI